MHRKQTLFIVQVETEVTQCFREEEKGKMEIEEQEKKAYTTGRNNPQSNVVKARKSQIKQMRFKMFFNDVHWFGFCETSPFQSREVTTAWWLR